MGVAQHLTFRFALGAGNVYAWSVKTRRVPSRHCRDAGVYGRTTGATHDIEYTPPSPYGHTTTAMHDIESTLSPLALSQELEDYQTMEHAHLLLQQSANDGGCDDFGQNFIFGPYHPVSLL